MRDSLGGLVVIIIIVVFITVVSGYMAFNVNYTKAFRVKNKIISIYEDLDGVCDITNCEGEISKYAESIGYQGFNAADLDCPSYAPEKKQYYCVQKHVISYNSGDSVQDLGTGVYYTIVTRVDMQIPILKKVFDFRFFYVSGDTKTFRQK